MWRRAAAVAVSEHYALAFLILDFLACLFSVFQDREDGLVEWHLVVCEHLGWTLYECEERVFLLKGRALTGWYRLRGWPVSTSIQLSANKNYRNWRRARAEFWQPFEIHVFIGVLVTHCVAQQENVSICITKRSQPRVIILTSRVPYLKGDRGLVDLNLCPVTI